MACITLICLTPTKPELHEFFIYLFIFFFRFSCYNWSLIFLCPCIFNEAVSFSVFETLYGFLEHFSVQYTAMTVKTYFLKKIFIFNLTFVVNLVQKFSTVDVLGDH